MLSIINNRPFVINYLVDNNRIMEQLYQTGKLIMTYLRLEIDEDVNEI